MQEDAVIDTVRITSFEYRRLLERSIKYEMVADYVIAEDFLSKNDMCRLLGITQKKE